MEETSPDRIEIRLHGRGGQGTVTAAALLVDAAFRSGWHALGFPAFGTERTGAPVAAFVRLDRAPIRDRSEVRHPSIVIVLDPTLVGTVDILDGLRDGGMVLVNAVRLPASLEGTPVAAISATALAMRHLGAPLTGTAMLGFLAAATGLVDLEALCAAIHDRFEPDAAARNEALVREAARFATKEAA